jgi:hypothetical protein
MSGGKQGGKQKPLKAPKAPKKEYDEVCPGLTSAESPY